MSSTVENKAENPVVFPNGWESDGIIGQGSFGVVYRAKRVVGTNTEWAAIKHISMPRSEADLSAIYSELGTRNEKTVNDYLNKSVQDMRSEYFRMKQLQGYTNIVSCQDIQQIPKKDGIGYDVYIWMELLESLDSRMIDGKMDRTETIKMGMDICRALSLLRSKGIVHRDIKPQNILVNDHGDYKLGDFGSAKGIEGTSAILTMKGTLSYTAPEIILGKPAGFSSDIYSLGLVMYRLMNRNRHPFMQEGDISSGGIDESNAKRWAGEEMAMPVDADLELGKIILKACAYETRNRWQSPEDMFNALAELGEGTMETLSPPPPPEDPPKDPPPQSPFFKQPWFIAACAGSVLLLTALILILMLRKSCSSEEETFSDVTVIPVSVETSTPEPISKPQEPTEEPTPEPTEDSTPTPTPTPTPAPIVALTSVSNEADGVLVTWQELSGSARYRVFRKEEGGSWKKVGDTVYNEYTDQSAKSGTTYIYTVRALSADGESYTSSYDSNGLTLTYIAAPQLTSVLNVSNGIQVNWKSVTGAEKYRVFRKENGGSWKKVGDTSDTTYTDTSINPGTYTYTVRCLSADGETYISSYDSTGGTATYNFTPTPSPTPNPVDSISVGDYYKFGSYKQNSSSKDPIEWRVLAKDGSRILVISRYILDVQAYHSEKGSITWQECDLRRWLNVDFLIDAFSDEERKMIPKVTVKADSNPNSPSADPGNDSQDYVFLLSIKEVNRYLKSDTARKCKTTKYSKSAYTNFGYTRWWLRTPGGYTTQAAFVDEDGEIKANVVYDNSYGVRPALWIDLG